MRHRLLSWAVAGLTIAASAAHAASFDCAEATKPDETAVCTHPELSALDSEMGGLWFAYSRFPFLMGASGARHDDARQFLTDRAACSTDAACLRTVYEARIAALRDGVQSAIAGMAGEQQADSGLPVEVAAIMAGYTPQCHRLGGTMELSQPFTLTGDFDGDGRTDYLLDPQNLECSGAATAFCGNGGCQISIALSGRDYVHPVSVLGGQPTLVQQPSGVDVAIWVDGANCGLTGRDQACWARLSWPDGKLHRAFETRHR